MAKENSVTLDGFYGRLGNQVWQLMSLFGIAQRNDARVLLKKPSDPIPGKNDFQYLPYFPALQQYFTLSADHMRPSDANRHVDEQFKTHYARVEGRYTGEPVKKQPIRVTGQTYVCGLLQAHHFYHDHLDQLRDLFDLETAQVITPNFDHTVLQCLQEGAAILVHHRGGDYTDSDLYPVLNERYYDQALATLRTVEGLPDDTPIIVATEPGEENVAFLKDKYPQWHIVSNTAMEDWFLFKEAKHIVTANSTFSLTGATLNKNNPTIIQPSRFFTPQAHLDNADYIFPGTIVVDNDGKECLPFDHSSIYAQMEVGSR